MRILFLLFCLALSPGAQAATEIIYGSGSEFGFCDGSFFATCSRNLERQAEERGRQDTVMRCQMRGGRMFSYAPFCSSRCNPNWLPHDAPSTYVRCDANCNGRCELP
jgi:hypothetical protein